ncbi:MAG: hypothetical protein OCD76_11975 [Reichenbachiella sp.]
MKPTHHLLLAIVLLGPHCYSQTGDFSIGARSAALAGSSVTISDPWALFNNIGALADVQSTNLIASYKNKYGLADLSSIAVGATSPLWNGTIGVGVFRYGGDLLNEHQANIGFSNRFGLVSLGINIDYYQISIENGGSSSTFMIDFGGQAKIFDQLYFGAHISNINQARISKNLDKQIPTVMKTGLSYRPHASLMINAEIQKSIDEQAFLIFGLEYFIIDSIALRMGFQNNPFESNFGIGFKLKKFDADYAYGLHPDLGSIHQVSFSYQIKE